MSSTGDQSSTAPTSVGSVLAEMVRITPVVGELGELFTADGHELYLVGGTVRDALLGRLGHDLDLTTSAHPDEIERLLKAFARKNSGATWDIGRKFGTIGCQVLVRDGNGTLTKWLIEVTTFRSDAYLQDSRKPEVEFGDTIDGDLVRRDFTVNAMAIGLPGQEFHDPYNGISDLAAATLRTPATPEQSFSDDPLRMMRAARFASQLEFAPTPAVAEAMASMADRIKIISAERVRDELSKLLLTDHPRTGLDLLVRTGLAAVVLPELPALQLETDEHHRHKDVYAHSLIVLEQAIELQRVRGHAPDLVTRLAALLHDIGKPATRTFEPGNKVSFHHHDIVGAKLSRKRLQALRFSTDEIKSVSRLVELHLRFHGYGEGTPAGQAMSGWTDSAVRRYVRDAGPELERLHILTRADCTTRNRSRAARLRTAYDDLEQRIGELAAREELDALRPDLDGTQIMEILGIGPGREVGQAYRNLLELRIDNGPLGEDAARAALLAWWEQRPRT